MHGVSHSTCNSPSLPPASGPNSSRKAQPTSQVIHTSQRHQSMTSNFQFCPNPTRNVSMQFRLLPCLPRSAPLALCHNTRRQSKQRGVTQPLQAQHGQGALGLQARTQALVRRRAWCRGRVHVVELGRGRDEPSRKQVGISVPWSHIMQECVWGGYTYGYMYGGLLRARCTCTFHETHRNPTGKTSTRSSLLAYNNNILYKNI
jgi:hypothetical protein